MVPQITTSPLNRPDGSATYTDALFSVLAAVNGPVEVSRRDELPEEATLEINIRPASGVGGPRERWLESVLHSLLRSIVLVHLHPRTLIQVTLQVVREPGVKFSKGRGEVAILPTLVNAAFLACVDGGVPLETTMSAVLVAVGKGGEAVVGPSGPKELEGCESLHAVGFGAEGGMLLDESTGRFEMGVWEVVVDKALERCRAAFASEGEDEAMGNGDGEEPWLRQVLEEKVRDAEKWREST